MSATSPCIPLTRFLAAVAAVAAVALAACQSPSPTGNSGFAPVPAPVFAVGDHWQYKITDNLRRGAVTMLDMEVVSISGGIVTLQLVYTDANGTRRDASREVNASDNLVVGALKEEQTRRYPTPLEMYQFPLQGGATWRQVVDTISPETQLKAQILVYGKVQDQSQVTVPAGSFDTVYVYRILQLDDEQFYRTRTERRDSVWYAPQVKGPARELHDAQYTLFGGGPGVGSVVRTENTTSDLLSFKAGK